MIYLIIIGAFIGVCFLSVIVNGAEKSIKQGIKRKEHELYMHQQQMEPTGASDTEGGQFWAPISSRKQREKYWSDEPYLPCGKKMQDWGHWKCVFDDDKDFGPNHICDADYAKKAENKTKEFVQGQPWVGM